MSDKLGLLMERNLLEVFGQRDSARRAAAIAELYTADCTFFEAEEQVTGREALNAKVGSILKGAPGFVFRAVGPAQVNHDLGRLRWQLGPAGAGALTGNFGPTFFIITSPTGIVAPNSGTPQGDTTVQGFVSSTAVPEPATMAMVGGLLIGLAALARKRRA